MPTVVAVPAGFSIFWGSFRLPNSAASSAIGYTTASWRDYMLKKADQESLSRPAFLLQILKNPYSFASSARSADVKRTVYLLATRMTRHSHYRSDKMSRFALLCELGESYSSCGIRGLAEGARAAPILRRCLAVICIHVIPYKAISSCSHTPAEGGR